MKPLKRIAIFKTIATLFLLSFFQATAWAQESSESPAITIERHAWYTQPWAVVTGIALVLIIIVVLVPSNPDGSGTNKVEYLKTSEPEANM